MAEAPFGDLLLYLRKVCGTQAARDLTDAEILERSIRATLTRKAEDVADFDKIFVKHRQ
jgi:hypothetical protein